MQVYCGGFTVGEFEVFQIVVVVRPVVVAGGECAGLWIAVDICFDDFDGSVIGHRNIVKAFAGFRDGGFSFDDFKDFFVSHVRCFPSFTKDLL